MFKTMKFSMLMAFIPEILICSLFTIFFEIVKKFQVEGPFDFISLFIVLLQYDQEFCFIISAFWNFIACPKRFYRLSKIL